MSADPHDTKTLDLFQREERYAREFLERGPKQPWPRARRIESAPRDERVLLWQHQKPQWVHPDKWEPYWRIGAWADSDGWRDDCYEPIENPSHWRPVPPDPKP